MSVHLSVAGRSDVGRSRTNNEDALIVADLAGVAWLRGPMPQGRFEVARSGVLLAVSDGMGGEKAGEVASAMVVDALARHVAGGPPAAPADRLLKEGVELAHREVFEAAHRAAWRGMGATLTALLVQNRGSLATALIAEVLSLIHI